MMARIKIEWLNDHADCEICGTTYADGAKVFVDGELALDLSPSAHCSGGADYQPHEVLEKTLHFLGHEVENA
jgi:hypothetical protein